MASQGVYICLLVGCIWVTTSVAQFGLPCTITPSWWGENKAKPGETKEAHSDSNCKNGTMSWNYPQGFLKLHFKYVDPSKEFRVCLSGRMLTTYTAIEDVSSGKTKDLIPPKGSKDPEVCSSYQPSEVVFMLAAPPGLMYMVFTEYRLEFQ